MGCSVNGPGSGGSVKGIFSEKKYIGFIKKLVRLIMHAQDVGNFMAASIRE